MANNNIKSIGDIRKKFHQTHELISTAYHEGGHTIYGLLHYIKIESISVFEDKKTKRIGGSTNYDHIKHIGDLVDPILFNNRLHAEIGLFYSGLIAEKHFFKLISGSNKFPMFLRYGSWSDINEAAILFQKYNLSEPGRKRYCYKQKIIKNIGLELQNHWDAVNLVAHELIKKKKINFCELQDILSKKTLDKVFWKNKFKIINYLYDNCNVLDEKNIKSILSI